MSDDNTRLCKCGHMEYHHRPECGHISNFYSFGGQKCKCRGFDAARGGG